MAIYKGVAKCGKFVAKCTLSKSVKTILSINIENNIAIFI